MDHSTEETPETATWAESEASQTFPVSPTLINKLPLASLHMLRIKTCGTT